MNNAKYCPSCNYAVADILYRSAKYDYPCPDCGESVLSSFYSVGSIIHHKILNGDHWQSTQLIKRSVPPLETEDVR